LAEVIFEKAIYFGEKTNNEAEYLALINALTWLKDFSDNNKLEQVDFYLDSKLVVEQMQKNWKIKEPRLRELAQQGWEIINSLPYSVFFHHVLRHKNTQADLLANQAMDSQGL